MVEVVRSPIFEKIIQKTVQSTFPKIWDDHLHISKLGHDLINEAAESGTE